MNLEADERQHISPLGVLFPIFPVSSRLIHMQHGAHHTWSKAVGALTYRSQFWRKRTRKMPSTRVQEGWTTHLHLLQSNEKEAREVDVHRRCYERTLSCRRSRRSLRTAVRGISRWTRPSYLEVTKNCTMGDLMDNFGSTFLAEQLRRAGLDTCSNTPQFFTCRRRHMLLEVHVVD